MVKLYLHLPLYVGLSLFTLVGLTPSESSAQAWVTQSACALKDEPFDADSVSPGLAQAVAQAEAATPNPTGRFWRITSNAGQVSHIWGTMHSCNPAVLRVPQPVTEKIVSARVLAVESNPHERPRHILQRDFSGRHFFDHQRGKVFWYSLTPEARVLINRRLVAIGYWEDTGPTMTPFGLVASLLSDPCNDFWSGYPIQDRRIQLLAEEAGAEIVSLEAENAFLQFASDPGNLEAVRELVEGSAAVVAEKKFQERNQAAYALYKEGRLAALGAMFPEELKLVYGAEVKDAVSGAADRWILNERNRNFVARIKTELDEGGVFMAVGAAHLPGADGLIELLRDEGFHLDRIPVSGEID